MVTFDYLLDGFIPTVENDFNTGEEFCLSRLKNYKEVACLQKQQKLKSILKF